MDYALGFLFDEYEDKVLLIHKTHPDWQKGKLNGIGGKVEESESFGDAMRREFFEETGCRVDNRRMFCEMSYPNGVRIVCFYSTQLIGVHKWDKEKYPETPEWFGISEIHHLDVIDNLKWLIPISRERHTSRIIIFTNK